MKLLTFHKFFGTNPVFEMVTDSGLSCKTKEKSDPQVTSPTQNQFISRQKGTEVNVLISIQHIIWQGLPFTLLLPLTTYGHRRGRTGIKCWVREDRKCVREMKEINITSAGCWAGQLVDNECVPLQSGNKRLLLTPASTSRSPAHLIILQSNAHTQQSTDFANI